MSEVSSLRLAFMGSPEFSIPTLKALIDVGHDVVSVYTQPPKPAGRGHKETPCPVHAWAESNNLDVKNPRSLRDPSVQNEFSKLNLDVAIVIAYGLILPREVLNAPRLGCLNVHASLLPRWRGAAPIQRALIAGDSETGVGIMKMDEGLDTGPVLAEARTPISDDETASSLHDRLSEMGAELMVNTLGKYNSGELVPIDQSTDGVTYAEKLSRNESKMDFSEPAEMLERKVRALNPWPGTWFEIDGTRIKVMAAEVVQGLNGPIGTVLDDDLAIACGEKAIRPIDLQRPGKGKMARADFLRGFPIHAGTKL